MIRYKCYILEMEEFQRIRTLVNERCLCLVRCTKADGFDYYMIIRDR